MRGVPQSVESPYETLSDIGLCGLGLFVFLTVALVIVSTVAGPQANTKQTGRQKDLQKTLEASHERLSQAKQHDWTTASIARLKEEFGQAAETKQKIIGVENTTNGTLNVTTREMEQIKGTVEAKARYDQAKVQYIAEMAKLEAQLKSLADRNTGDAIDRTGRAHLLYGSNTIRPGRGPEQRTVLIGPTGAFTAEEFAALLKSFGANKQGAFFVRFSRTNSTYFGNDLSEPDWLRKVWKTAGYVTVKVPVKPGFEDPPR